MQRRALIVSGAASAVLARPIHAQQPARPRVLRYAAATDLAITDPFLTTAYITSYHALAVWDQLYGLDSDLQPRPQMVEGATTEQDGKLWTFRLREGLRFHDGEPVRGRDCVASIRRWAARDPIGQALMARVADIAAPDDRSFTIRLNRPFGLLLFALAKVGPPALVVLPERLAATDPYKAIPEIVGSGPFRFLPNERVAGSRVVYERNPDYQPRQDRTDALAGAKVVNFDRVEWLVLPDPATKAAALRTGEVDWWENPPNDLLPVLEANRDIRTQPSSRLGIMGTGIFNHLHPPFDKAAVRRIVLEAMSQADFATAVAGSAAGAVRDGVGIFTPGTPMANDAGLSAVTGPKRDLPTLRSALREAGYQGEKVVLMSASDSAELAALGAVGHDLLQKLGMQVDYVVTEWGSLVQRRANKAAPDKGGWNMFHTSWYGIDMTTPVTNQPLRSNGANAYVGWPDLPDVQGRIDAWLDAPDVAAQKRIAAELQAAALEQVPYLPTGQYFTRTAFRSDIAGIVPGQYVFWSVRRT